MKEIWNNYFKIGYCGKKNIISLIRWVRHGKYTIVNGRAIRIRILKVAGRKIYYYRIDKLKFYSWSNIVSSDTFENRNICTIEALKLVYNIIINPEIIDQNNGKQHA